MTTVCIVDARGNLRYLGAFDDSESGKEIRSRFVADAVAGLGGLDILVNNAGVTRDKLIMQMTEDDWDAVVDTNLKGVFNVTKHAARTMAKQHGGRIVNIGSISGSIGLPERIRTPTASSRMSATGAASMHRRWDGARPS